MLKFCKGFIMKNALRQKDPSAYAHWRNSHICKFNYVGTARGMETEEANWYFKDLLRSVTLNTLR